MNTRNRSSHLAYGMYILSMLIFGTNGYFVSHISFGGTQIVLLRTLIGGVLLTALVMARGGFDRAGVRRDRLPLALGGVALGMNWVALFEAYRLLNVSLATLIYYVGPILVLMLSPILFREKLTKQKLLSALFVGAGLVCISGSIVLSGMDAAGLISAVISALFYAGLIIFNKKIVHTGGLQTAALEVDVAFVVVLVYTLMTTGLPHPAAADLPYIVAIGAVNTALAYLLYFSGLQKLSGQSAALISYIDPVSALIFSALLLGESMTGVQTLGAVCIIGGAMLGELKPKRSGT